MTIPIEVLIEEIRKNKPNPSNCEHTKIIGMFNKRGIKIGKGCIVCGTRWSVHKSD